MEWLFLFLYGAVALTSIFLALFWAWFSRKRFYALRPKSLKALLSDRYYVLSTGLSIGAGGMALLCGTRVVSNIHYGLSNALRGAEGVGIGLGLVTVLFAKTMLIWLADLEKDPPVWTWTRWALVATVLWGLAAAGISAWVGLPSEDVRLN